MSRRHWVILSVIVLAAAALRAYRIDAAGLWADELMSLQQSTGRAAAQFDPPTDVFVERGADTTSVHDSPRPLLEIRAAFIGDTHPPLYALLLRFWRATFGESDAAARAMSALWSVLAIVFLFDSARLLHGRAAGLWAAGVMALATPQIQFAHEARGYAMLVALALAACSALVRIEKLGASRLRLIALGASVLGALLTHYSAIPVAIALTIYVLLRLRAGARNRTLIVLVVVVAVFAVIWGPLLFQQRANFAANLGWVRDDAPGIVGRTMVRIATLPLKLLVTPMLRWESFAATSAMLYVAAIVLLIWRRRFDLLLWILLLAAVIVPAAISDATRGMKTLDQMRYTLAAGPAIYALLASLLSDAPRLWMRHALPAAAVLSCALSLGGAYDTSHKPDVRALVRELNVAAGARDVLLFTVASQDDWYHAVLYGAVTHYAPPDKRNRPLVVLTQPATPDVVARLHSAPRVWVISGGADPPVVRLIPEARMQELRGVPRVGFFQRVIFED
jgi:mannosyltransferase